MPERDHVTLPNGSAKHFQHLVLRIREHCGGLKQCLEFVGIADTTYRRLMNDKILVKTTAQKILNAYSKIAPYNNKGDKHAA